MKENYIALLRSTNRPGIDELIEYLENETDFFTAPASTQYHLNYEGGLLEHSLNVYNQLMNKNTENQESTIIVSLLHDICKANYYKKIMINKKINNAWQQVESYTTDDQYPLGHGEKSVILVQRFITLTEDEILAIRWHMGGFESKDNYKYLNKAFSKCKLAFLLHEADMEATYLLENK